VTDWGLFDTPFGPRTGGVVPALLEKLDASDARVRAKALTDLHHRVVAVNGGAGPPFLPIAGALVPVLGARLAAPGVLSPQLGQVLEVLGDIAAGNHRLVAASGLPVDALDRDDIGPARENRAAVAALVAAIRARLADEDPAVRAAAAFALAWLPGEASSSVPALLARLARGVEKNAVARASALVALGYLGGPVDALRALRSEKAPVGVAAGIAAMLADPARMDDDLDVVLPELAKPVVKGFPFLDGALGRLRVVVIGGATIRRGDLAAHRALVARMPEKHRAEAAVWTVRVAAAQCSPSSSRSLEPLDPAALPEEAREALREQARAADRTPGVGAAFRRIGLFSSTPDDARAARCACGRPSALVVAPRRARASHRCRTLVRAGSRARPARRARGCGDARLRALRRSRARCALRLRGARRAAHGVRRDPRREERDARRAHRPLARAAARGRAIARAHAPRTVAVITRAPVVEARPVRAARRPPGLGRRARPTRAAAAAGSTP
jgi:hypothetical protein